MLYTSLQLTIQLLEDIILTATLYVVERIVELIAIAPETLLLHEMF